MDRPKIAAAMNPRTSLGAEEETDSWASRLAAGHPDREPAIAELYELLLSAARSEASRRRGLVPDWIRADVDDLCVQAADDALAAVLGKLESFRGESRFTTWAYKFAVFAISSRLRRHVWHDRRVDFDEAAWNRLRAPDDAAAAEQREMLRVIREAMDADLSDRQRLVFDTVVIQEVPIDVLAERLDSTRGAIYKILHDARRKIRTRVQASGYGEHLP